MGLLSKGKLDLVLGLPVDQAAFGNQVSDPGKGIHEVIFLIHVHVPVFFFLHGDQGRQINGEQPVNTLVVLEGDSFIKRAFREASGAVRGISRGNLLQQAQGGRKGQQPAGAPGQEGGIGQS